MYIENFLSLLFKNDIFCFFYSTGFIRRNFVYMYCELREHRINLIINDIHRCLPPDGTLLKVIEPKVDYSGDLREGKVGHEPRLEP